MATKNINIAGGSGISVTENEDMYTVSADSTAVLINDIDNIEADNVQEALVAIADKLTDVEGIAGGSVIKATPEGYDPEYSDSAELLPNGLYIRLENTSGKRIYVSAYEIDKAIGIIGDMTAGKADIADFEALEIELASKASKTQVDLMQADVDSKATKDSLNSLSSVVDTKADKTTVEMLSADVDSKATKDSLNSLSTIVDTKADKTTVEMLSADVDSKAKATDVNRLRSDVEALKTTLESLSDNTTIISIKNQIKYLNDEINKMLSIDDVKHLEEDILANTERLVDVNEKIDLLEDAIANKASKTYVQSQITELNGAITAMSTRVNAKADKKDIALKANQTDMDIVVKRLYELSLSTEADFAELEECCRLVQEELKVKASKTYVDTNIADINNIVNTKADANFVDEKLVKLNDKINKVETNFDASVADIATDVYELECEVDNKFKELNTSINNQNKQIVENISQINQLKQNDIKTNEALKQQWVRVMTPEEYNNLSPIGSSSVNAKKANVIYMLVRYNKPTAVYIGDILIAQAEHKDSQGFAYTFPIVF